MTDDAELRGRMVDVTGKKATRRQAVASCRVRMSVATRDRVIAGDLPKGEALGVARLAAIMGAKRTADLIPLCHPIAIGSIEVTLNPVDDGFEVTATVATVDRTGVEMEALTGAALGALTIYDMVKSIERGVEITGLRLLEKSGGRSGDWKRT